MKNNTKVRKKDTYTAPKIDILPLELEYGIAASSAIVRPPDTAGEIKTEWEVGTERNVEIDW